jgi:hypothetical protein
MLKQTCFVAAGVGILLGSLVAASATTVAPTRSPVPSGAVNAAVFSAQSAVRGVRDAANRHLDRARSQSSQRPRVR